MNPKINIGILLVTIFLGLLAIDLHFNRSTGIYDYIRNLSVGILTIIITVYLVEYFIKKHYDKKESERKLANANRINGVIGIYVSNLILRINIMLADYKNEHSIVFDKKNLIVNENFEFSRLANIFDPSFSVLDKFYEPSFKQYFIAQSELQSAIEKALINIEMTELEDLLDLLVQYLSITNDFKIAKSIEEDYEMVYQSGKNIGKKVHLNTKSLIKNHSNNIEFKNGNVLNKYYSLYHLLNYEISFIHKYSCISQKYTSQKT